MMCALQNVLYLFVDFCGLFFTVILFRCPRRIEEQTTPLLLESAETKVGAHPVLSDHASGRVGSLLQIVLGAGGHVAEDDLLCDSTTQQDAQAIFQLRTDHEI